MIVIKNEMDYYYCINGLLLILRIIMILANDIRIIIKMNHINDDIDGVQWIATTTKKNKDTSIK